MLMTQVRITELTTCSGVILYSPLKDEVDPLLFPQLRAIHNRIVLPCDAEANVTEWVDTCNTFGNGKNVCVCVPGTAFDATGTRHGRGGGWYDKFLSQIPKEWIRVGIATPTSFMCDTKLTRQSWDEPVDYVLVYSIFTGSWSVYKVSSKRPGICK